MLNKGPQRTCGLKIISTKGEPIAIILLNWPSIKWNLMTYPHIHRLAWLSTLIREAPIYRRWWLKQTYEWPICRKQRLVHAHPQMEHLCYTSLYQKKGKDETRSFSPSREAGRAPSAVVSTSMIPMQAQSRANLTNSG